MNFPSLGSPETRVQLYCQIQRPSGSQHQSICGLSLALALSLASPLYWLLFDQEQPEVGSPAYPSPVSVSLREVML